MDYLKPIRKPQTDILKHDSVEKTLKENESWLRVYILDSLVVRSGQILSPNLIGEITSELVDLLKHDYKKKPASETGFNGL